MDDRDSFELLVGRVSRRRLLQGAALGTVGLAAAALIGCGDDDDDDDDDDAVAATATQAAQPTATVQGASATEAPSEGGPQDGGVFRWHFSFPITVHQDPHFVGGRGSFAWMFLGDVGVRWNARGDELTPDLLNSWESADGLVHTVTVRPGVKTHNVPLTNGRLFDAEDAALNLKRMAGLLDPDNISKYHKRGGLKGMSDASAVDESVLNVTFDEPAPHFPQGLTDYLMFFIPREDFQDTELFNDPAALSGTGPFLADEYRDGELQTFKRNPDFWGGRPYLDGIELRQVGDRVSQMSDFLQKNAEYLENPSRVDRQTVEQQYPSSQLHAWPGSTCAYMKFNVTRPPFDDVRVRTALQLATNYVLNENDFWGEGFWGPAAVINNAHGAALQKDDVLKLPGWRLDKKEEDIAEAQKLLAAAGFPEGAGLDFKVLGSEASRNYGYDFSIRQLDDWHRAFPEISAEIDLAADRATQTSRQNEQDFDFTMRAAVSVAPAAVDASSHWGTGGSANVGGYSNSTLDDILARARTTADQANEAPELVQEAEQLLLEDMPGTIVHRLYQAGIYGENVRGIPTIQDGDRPLAGNFENWNSVHRHSAVLWLEK